MTSEIDHYSSLRAAKEAGQTFEHLSWGITSHYKISVRSAQGQTTDLNPMGRQKRTAKDRQWALSWGDAWPHRRYDNWLEKCPLQAAALLPILQMSLKWMWLCVVSTEISIILNALLLHPLYSNIHMEKRFLCVSCIMLCQVRLFDNIGCRIIM